MRDAFERDLIAHIKRQTLAALDDATRDPKPSYAVDDATVSWDEYQARLRQTVDWCDAKLREDAPFEARSRGVVG